MKRTILMSIALVMLCAGCGKTKVVSVQGAAKMNVGEQVSCVYSSENLYCNDQLLSKKEVDEPHMMDRFVFTIQSHADDHPGDSSSVESGSYPTSFATNPIDYSLWICSKTGNSNPAIKCTLQQNPDPKRIAELLEVVKFEDHVLNPLTPDQLIALCGMPKESSQSDISKTMIYPANGPGIINEVEFDTYTYRPVPKVSSITTVDEKTGNRVDLGMRWRRGNGWINEFAIRQLKTYMPCLK